MAEITKELGRIPVSRGDYQVTTEYYKDNIVQYKRGSYQVVSETPIIGVPPTNDKNVLNSGWRLFAGILDAQDVVNQIKDQESKSIQAVADREAEILAKSDASEISASTVGLGGSNVQANLNDASHKLSELDIKIDELHPIESNPEYADIVIDNDNKVIEAIRKDGTKVFNSDLIVKGKLLNEEFNVVEENVEELSKTIETKANIEDLNRVEEKLDETHEFIENEEFVDVTVDKDKRVTEGLTNDSKKMFYTEVVFNKDVSTAHEQAFGIDNNEFSEVILDDKQRVIIGIHKDGNVFFGYGVPSQIQEKIESVIAQYGLASIADALNGKVDKVDGKSLIDSNVANQLSVDSFPEFLDLLLDSNNKIINSVDIEGTSKHYTKNVYENVIETQTHNDYSIENNEFDKVTIDANGRIIDSINKDDDSYTEVHHTPHKFDTLILGDGTELHSKNEFGEIIKSLKLADNSNWSDYVSKDGKNPLSLPIPRCARLNIITDKDLTKLSKKYLKVDGKDAKEGIDYNIPAVVEYADMEGNYFKKNVSMSGQGTSSIAYEKKNIALDLFDKEQGGDAFSVKFGDWVAQDSFHLKAYYCEWFKGVSVMSYKLADQVARTRGYLADRTWKKGILASKKIDSSIFDCDAINDVNVQMDNGARCVPDAFPVIVYRNGEFYGIFAWSIKKHRDNYHQEKDNSNHIHLDGVINNGTLFGANGDASQISWNPSSGIEVRTPKGEYFVTTEGKQYDADLNARQELAGVAHYGDTIDNYNATITYSKGDMVKVGSNIYLSRVDSNAGNNPELAKSSKASKVWDNATDYWIDITFTSKVKNNILKLSTYKQTYLTEPSATRKQVFEQFYDVENLIDYELLQIAVQDSDAVSKNWQWQTYDGKKWFVNNYDKDQAFGCHYEGFATLDAPKEGGYIKTSGTPIDYVCSAYQAELKARWNELKDKGIFTTQNIMSVVNDWMSRIGNDNYKKEYAKWTEAPCNRDAAIDTDYWKLKHGYKNGASGTPSVNWDETRNYTVGDIMYKAYGGITFEFECVANCVGKDPMKIAYKKSPYCMGIYDNVWRLYKFVKQTIEVMDEFFR